MGPEIILVGAIGGAGVAMMLWAALKAAGKADADEATYEALKQLGFSLEEDAGAAWLQSRLPRMDFRHAYRTRSKRGSTREHEDQVSVRLARREDPQSFQVVFELPESFRRKHDRWAFAFDPKNQAVIRLPDGVIDAVRADTGWEIEAHGAWIVLYRSAPVETTAENIGAVVEEAVAIARRVLGGGVR